MPFLLSTHDFSGAASTRTCVASSHSNYYAFIIHAPRSLFVHLCTPCQMHYIFFFVDLFVGVMWVVLAWCWCRSGYDTRVTVRQLSDDTPCRSTRESCTCVRVFPEFFGESGPSPLKHTYMQFLEGNGINLYIFFRLWFSRTCTEKWSHVHAVQIFIVDFQYTVGMLPSHRRSSLLTPKTTCAYAVESLIYMGDEYAPFLFGLFPHFETLVKSRIMSPSNANRGK